MAARRRLLAAVNAVLLMGAATSAWGQAVEKVVVTAEKKVEELQSVPIAVSAFTLSDITDRQIDGVRDIQFATPNVNFTKTNFTSSNFSIRGIGTQVISSDSEYGVAFNVDDVYYAVPPIDAAQFYDLQRIEVLRGPQSTLYGRGATGGAVNVFSARPELDAFKSSVSGSYGNYNAAEFKAMMNVPLVTDELALRLAGDWVRHDGFTRDIFGGNVPAHVDSRDLWSGRASLRWQPNAGTTIDLIASHSAEADTRLRAQKQLCDTDPTGVLGCLSNAATGNGGAVNLNATFFNIPVSRQTLGLTFTPVYQGLGYPTGVAAATAQGLGLTDLSQPYAAPAGAVPDDPRVINSDVTPRLDSRSNAVTFEAKQALGDWLTATLVANYADSSFFSQESFTNAPGPALNPTALATSLGMFQNTIAAYAGAGLVPASYASVTAGPYAFVLNPSHAGTLPTSNFTNLGIIGGSINRYTANEYAYDQTDGRTKQNSIELRFASDLQGPVNFLAALYYLRADSPTDYDVAANTQDYGLTLLGALGGPLKAGALCARPGCIYATPYYHNDGDRVVIDSKALYGEVYYDAIPDTLKFTVGLRGTEDLKSYRGRISVLNGLVPVGTTDENSALAALVAQGQADFDAAMPGNQTYEMAKSKFDKLTGRAVVDYTPKLDFTDFTMLYASYARGYKAGGANPGVQAGNLVGIPATYAPESIDAYEIGAKNLFLDGALQANLTAWYYDYRNYQISSIVANTSVNTNIDAHLDGLEGELRWAATSRLEFDLNLDVTESHIGDTGQIDTRNPTAGNPNTLLIKDGALSSTNAGNCVLYYSGANFANDFATLQAASQGLFFAPPGGTAALAGSGVAHAAYGTCYSGTSAADPFYALSLNNPALAGLLAATHFAQSSPAIHGTLTGVPTNLKGNALGNTAPASMSVGAQYTQPLDGGFTLVGRLDWYWQAGMYGRIFNDPADHISPYGIANALLTLYMPSGDWSVDGYIKNIGDSAGITGEYLAGPSSGLYTSAFYTDPRTFGLSVSANF